MRTQPCRVAFITSACLAAALSLGDALPALAVNPGNSAGMDPWPAAIWLASGGDQNGDLMVNITDRLCSGTLIAPDLVVTAAHCFRDQGPGYAATIGFGNGNATNRTGTGTIHPNWGAPTSGPNVPAIGTPADLAVIRLTNPVTTVAPLPLMLRMPLVDDVVLFAGYGDTHTPPKRWSGPPHDNNLAPITPWDIDAISAEFTYAIPQEAGALEAFTEGGDSGGPEIYRAVLKPGFGFNFLVSALQGTMQTAPSGVMGETHTRVDRQANASGGASATSNVAFLNGAMPNPTSIKIKHNLPADPAAVNPNDMVGVYIEATYPAATRPSYVFSPMLFEDDFDLGLPTKNYLGRMAFGPVGFVDDLAGYAYNTGVLTGLETRVIAYDFVKAGALIAFDEALNPLDPPLDWMLDFNSNQLQFDLTNNIAPAGHMVMTATLAELNQLVSDAELDFALELAVQGMFMLAPEPAAATLLAVALLVTPRRRRERRRD